jgi:hypothetical protein
MTGQFDRIGDGEMVESKNRSRFEAAESADSVEGYADASEPDLATRCAPNEAAAAEKGDRLLLRLNDGWRLASRARNPIRDSTPVRPAEMQSLEHDDAFGRQVDDMVNRK